MKKVLSTCVALALAVGASAAYGDTIAAESTTSGNYSTTSNTALDFYVYTPITIDYLGVYDNGSTTLSGPVTVSIYEDSQFGWVTYASYTFSAGSYTLSEGNDVFVAITPVTLTVLNYTYNGPYVIAAYFGSPTQSEPTGTGQTLDTFGGDVAYGDEYSDNNPFNDGAGTSSNPVADTTFNAGTFALGTLVPTSPTPEPGSLVLLGTGFGLLGLGVFLRRRHAAAQPMVA